MHIVHNVLWTRKAMRNETGAYCDNHRSCSHSDAATCLYISQWACRPLCRVRHEVYQLLIFSFSVARLCLAAEAESDRNHQSGPDMAQNHAWGPFCRYSASDTRSRQHILCKSAPKVHFDALIMWKIKCKFFWKKFTFCVFLCTWVHLGHRLGAPRCTYL